MLEEEKGQSTANYLSDHTEVVPFDILKRASDKWERADLIREVVLFLTRPVREVLTTRRDSIAILRLIDFKGTGNKDWAFVYTGDSVYSQTLDSHRPFPVDFAILAEALQEIFDAAKASEILAELRAGEPLVVRPEPTSMAQAIAEKERLFQLQLEQRFQTSQSQ